VDADTALPSRAPTATTSNPAPPRGPLSLAARAAIATGFVLAGFLGLVGLTLSQANQSRALSALQERLQNFALAYITDTGISRYGKLLPPDTSPDPNFLRPGSGLYAVSVGDNSYRWGSPSAIGRDFSFMKILAPGEKEFVGPVDTHMGRLYYYSYGVALDDEVDRKSARLTVMVAQTEDQLEGDNAVYRRSLVVWLSILGVMLIVLQFLLLRWSLTPLRKVASDMTRVERGDSEHLDSQYPLELTGLTERINVFIDNEREQRTRYRHTLADLAHSLKTPLAVIRSQLESAAADDPLRRSGVLDQVRRMDDLVAYQLSRAATSGRQTFAIAVPIAGHAEDLVQSLEKVYAAKNVLCEFDIDESAVFYGEQGDLLELMGNLLENAFKWADHRVLLVVKAQATTARQRPGLWLSVEDDGPGIAADKIEKVLQRGVRGDERVQGHGIGLSIVQDIVHAYQGELLVDRSAELGGARFSVTLTPT
jgi:two-component system, OmpR family, sensor histidine kinase PhoQ